MSGSDVQQKRQKSRIYEYRCPSCDKLHFKGHLAVGLLETKCRCGRFLTFGDDPLRDDVYYTITLNRQGLIVSASASVEDILGYRASELLQMHISDITFYYDAQTIETVFEKLWQTYRNEDKLYYDTNVLHRKKNGELLHCHMYWRFVKFPRDDYFFAIFQSPKAKHVPQDIAQLRHTNVSYIEINPEGGYRQVVGEKLAHHRESLYVGQSVLPLFSHPQKVQLVLQQMHDTLPVQFLDGVYLKEDALETTGTLLTREDAGKSHRIYVVG